MVDKARLPIWSYSASAAPRATVAIDIIRGRVKSLARTFRYNIRKMDSHFQKRPIDFIRSRKIDVVVDLGANIGQYAEQLRHAGYRGWIVSAEPIRAIYDVLAARAAADPRRQVLNLAFGEVDGSAQINVSKVSVFSSLHAQLPSAVTFNPESRVIRRETIRIARLDEVFAHFPKRSGISQNRHLRLRGADADGWRRLHLRIPRRPDGASYHQPLRGDATVHKAVTFMNQRGFEISNIAPVNYDRAGPM